MTTYCTYCSAEKNQSTFPLPAIDLYKSLRIETIFKQANKDNASFIILSGKYGIISPDENTSYYDHLLVASEVEKHVELITRQLKAKGITAIVFFMNSIEQDQNLHPYLDCMERACNQLNISLEIRFTDIKD